jgi:hypothetical protein
MPKDEKTPAKPARKPAVRKPVVRRRRAAAAAPAVTHDQIAERAYRLYLDGSEGDAFAHWLRAERELTAA